MLLSHAHLELFFLPGELAFISMCEYLYQMPFALRSMWGFFFFLIILATTIILLVSVLCSCF